VLYVTVLTSGYSDGRRRLHTVHRRTPMEGEGL